MEYKIETIIQIGNETCDISAFASEFAIDKNGTMFLYTSYNSITKIGLDKKIENYVLPDKNFGNSMSFPSHKPILTEECLFHVRDIENAKGCYILITDINMIELKRIYIKGNPIIYKIIVSDDNIYFVASNFDCDKNKCALFKMTMEGQICWEYIAREGVISDEDFEFLNDGKTLLLIRDNELNVSEGHIVDKDGKLDFVINGVTLPCSSPRFSDGKAKLFKDYHGDICIYTSYPAIYETGNKLIKNFEYQVIVLDFNGIEKYRNVGNNLSAVIPKCFYKHRYLFSSNYKPGKGFLLTKVDILEDTEEIIADNGAGFLISITYFENKAIIIHGDGNESVMYLLDSDEKNLFQENLDFNPSFIEVSNGYIYCISDEKIAVYQITKE